MAANVVSYPYNMSQPTEPKITLGSVMLIVLAVLVFIQITFRARAGIIAGTKSILDKKPTNFSKAFVTGGKYYVRLFGIWLVTVFLMLLVAVILAAPVGYLYSINYGDRATILGLFALAIFIPVSIVINFINNIAPMFVVLHDLRLGPAIAASLDMIRKFWVIFLFFSVMLGVLSLAASFLVVMVAGGGVVFLIQIFYNTAAISYSFGSVLLGICGAVAFLVFAGAIAAFQQIAWVLLFERIIKPQKIEEEEPLPMPEIIS